MAFTSGEKARIRSLGGWGARWSQTETRLESSMRSIEQTLPAEENLIRSYLTKLTALDTLITESHDNLGVKQTGSIVLDTQSGMLSLKSEGARLVTAIFNILECDVRTNFYASGSPRGGRIQYG